MSSKQETGFEEKLKIAEEDIAIEHNRAMYVFNFSLYLILMWNQFDDFYKQDF